MKNLCNYVKIVTFLTPLCHVSKCRCVSLEFLRFVRIKQPPKTHFVDSVEYEKRCLRKSISRLLLLLCHHSIGLIQNYLL